MELPATHDLGGVPGYGPVPHDRAEPAFHDDWERRVWAMFGGVLRLVHTAPGEFRHALERLDPADYFGRGYYGRWLSAFELLLEERGVIDAGAVDARLGVASGTGAPARAAPSQAPDEALLPPDEAAPPVDGSLVRRELARRPGFAVGDAVRVRTIRTPGHTRVPAYIADRRGTVAAVHPAEVLPDSTAHGLGERPQHIYAVGFAGSELWGDDAEAGVTVHVDVYECHLEPVE